MEITTGMSPPPMLITRCQPSPSATRVSRASTTVPLVVVPSSSTTR